MNQSSNDKVLSELQKEFVELDKRLDNIDDKLTKTGG